MTSDPGSDLDVCWVYPSVRSGWVALSIDLMGYGMGWGKKQEA